MKNAQKLSKKKTPSTIISQVSEAESDRRLRPVIDALYTQNLKQAYKLVQQALQKRPGWPAARALRACYYMQMERVQEAQTEINGIREDFESQRAVVDEDTARKIHMYYQEIRREDIAGEFYELAWKNDPKNIKLAEIAFGLYVRGKDFAAAQKIATKLNRLTVKKDRYGMWAAIALWLSLKIGVKQGDGNNCSPDSRMLKLVTAMIAKAIDGSFIPTTEMVRFATRVYKEAGQIQEAYDLISHPRLVMDEAEVLHIRAGLGLERSTESDYRTLLSKYSADDWEDWISFLNIVSKKPNWQEDAYELVEKLIASLKRSQSKVGRGLYLARLEIHSRVKNYDALSKDIGQYFEMFGSKKVCAHDLRPYLSLLRDTEFFDIAMEQMKTSSNQQGFPSHLTFSWIKLWFNLLTDNVESLWKVYSSQVSNLVEKTDGQAGDEYLLLAAHMLLPLEEKNEFNRYANTANIMQCIIILEASLTLSPFNFRFKLLLIRLYTEIGALGRVGELWESLNVKHIQAATLSHLVILPLFESGHHDALQSVLEGIAHLWLECDREIPECISKALQHGSVNAATEFVLFREQLQQSAVLAHAQAIEAQLELVRGGCGSLGHQRALSCLTKSPRFKSNDLVNNYTTLIDTNNNQCYQFWTLKQDKNHSVSDEQDTDPDFQKPLPILEQQTLAMNLLSLEKLLDQEPDNLEKTTSSDLCLRKLLSTTEKVASGCLKLRVKIALNLQRIKLLLNQAALPSQEEENISIVPEDELAESREICHQLQSELHNIVTASDNGNESQFSSPLALRRCGSYVFDVLLLTGICISSLTPKLMKRQKRSKKSSAKLTEDQKSVIYFQSAREAILTYRNAILDTSSEIETWVTDLIDNEQASANALFGTDHNPKDVCDFLPETIEPINLIDGSKKAPGQLNRGDFCTEILADVHSSYMVTCSSILETLTNITRTLKLADF